MIDDRFQARVRSSADANPLRRERVPIWKFWLWFDAQCWVVVGMVVATAALFATAFWGKP